MTLPTVDATSATNVALTRRNMLSVAAGSVAGIAATAVAANVLTAKSVQAADSTEQPIAKPGSNDAPFKITNQRIQQSAVLWCFKPMSVGNLAAAASKLGMKSVELIGPSDWGVLEKHGLICAISGSHGFLKGFAHKEEHAECLDKLRESIDQTSDAGFPSVITFSGMRRGIDNDEGLKNMVDGLKQIVGHAEQKKVTICLEMLNSRVKEEMKGHPDYMCDTIEWAVEVCRRVGSPRMKILFDVYHVQIMQGDVITRIKQYHEYIGHYHTAGVPGRNEIDESQEVNYAPIMRAIVDTGYKGYVGQEFIPVKKDLVASLSQAARICDV